jgi:hypothetical protein
LKSVVDATLKSSAGRILAVEDEVGGLGFCDTGFQTLHVELHCADLIIGSVEHLADVSQSDPLVGSRSNSAGNSRTGVRPIVWIVVQNALPGPA